MVRQADFVDPEYDRKLAEYKALKAKARKEQEQQAGQQKQ